jgi:hypothetical protein
MRMFFTVEYAGTNKKSPQPPFLKGGAGGFCPSTKEGMGDFNFFCDDASSRYFMSKEG